MRVEGKKIMDKVSIIVPVYNVEKYLGRCIESLVRQGYKNLEIILIDDASKDNSRDIMVKYAKEDERIRLLYQSCNQGVSAARNRALKEATGEWICFCDGDDWYELDFVQKMLDCAKKRNADYIICNYKIVSDRNAAIVSGSIDAINKKNINNKLVVACGPTSSCTHMIKKELFISSNVRYPEGCRQNEELPVIPVLAKYAKCIAIVDEPLYCYYQRGNGSSASNIPEEKEENFLYAWNLMSKALGEGFDDELEYHAIYALVYGKILEMCKNRKTSAEIKQKIETYERMFPRYWENKYLCNIGLTKRVFIAIERKKMILILKFISWIHGKIVG